MRLGLFILSPEHGKQWINMQTIVLHSTKGFRTTTHQTKATNAFFRIFEEDMPCLSRIAVKLLYAFRETLAPFNAL